MTRHPKAAAVVDDVQPVVVRITVGAEVLVSGLPGEAVDEVISACTFPNPAFTRRERLGLWTGSTPPLIEAWNVTPAGLVVSRGAFALVARVCRQHGLSYDITDDTICPPLGLDLTPRGTLFDYQERALVELLGRRNGFFDGPTGSGKTQVALSAIPRLNTPTLLLTHTRGLLDQTAQRCRDWLGVNPGIIGASKWNVQPITIGMVQTLARRGCGDIANCFGAVLIDEAHHSPARTWTAVVNALPARFKYGFTATPSRKDGLHDLMWLTVGPINAKVNSADVVAAGKIIVPTVESVGTGFSFDLQGPADWTRMLSALARDRERNQLIAVELCKRLRPRTRALILTDRVEHVHLLVELLAEHRPVRLTGELTQSERKDAMADVRGGAQLTIATASLLGEGVDVPDWNLLVLASPFAGGTRTVQAVGRVCRAAPGKSGATVVDLVDCRVPALVAAHRQRESVLGRAS
jgi:superfamily II DNA or RNA helicase